MESFWSPFVFLALLCLGLFGCRIEKESVNSLTYGSSLSYVEVPAHYAAYTGIFEEHGLDVKLEIFSSGKEALQALVDKRVNIASMMSTPFVRSLIKNADLRVLASVEHGKFHSVVARTNSTSNTDKVSLKGKKVGVTPGTSGEYFMDSFLSRNAIPRDSLKKIIYKQGNELVDLFLKDSLDAVFSWHPYITKIKNNYQGTFVVLPSEKLVPPTWLIVSREPFLSENQSSVQVFLQSLIQSEDRISEDFSNALVAHAEVTQAPLRELKAFISQRKLDKVHVSLDQEILLDFEIQEQWLKEHRYLPENVSQDFRQFVAPDILKLIDQERVNISGQYVN